ncbi:MAG: Uma2 family endonuclease [Rhodococcus sp.]|uniref:Uma2 family endonuclease n=1 Tax=Rhodococcus TaxID=1827 RepID=UPI0016A1F903|nr:Uma2 family endonuclease [Rhodococcus sp. (in: high G+C Gram-positive bacteria)]NLV79803.1 Uma2 family endonuclease [Rhodococcus sp. (in: high G+C Gram-positive bacteria)]
MGDPFFPDHLLGLDEWAGLPDHEGHHVEVCEGVLVAVPRPGAVHDHAALSVVLQLDVQLPAEMCALGSAEVLVGDDPLTVRLPDAIVVDRALVEDDPDRAPASAVRMVVEVTDRGTARTDRVTKFSEYAEAGIPHYWIVDLIGPPLLAVFTLDDGWYRFDGEYSGKVRAPLFGRKVVLDLDSLVDLRRPRAATSPPATGGASTVERDETPGSGTRDGPVRASPGNPASSPQGDAVPTPHDPVHPAHR